MIDYTYAVSCRRLSSSLARARRTYVALTVACVMSMVPGLAAMAGAVPASRPHREATATWWVVAHRGYVGRHATEDGLPSLRRALSMGAAMAETDLRPSRDHRLIVHHEHLLSNTNCRHVAVYARAAGWISSRCHLRDGSRVPTVVDYLRTARARAGRVMLELKEAPNWATVTFSRLAAAVRRTGMVDRVVITSMSSKLLHAARSALPEVARWGWISNGRPPSVRSVRHHGANLVLAQVQDLTRRRISALHAAGIPVLGAVYRDGREVTHLHQWRHLYRLGADGFLTDHLRQALAWSRRLRGSGESPTRTARRQPTVDSVVTRGHIEKLVFAAVDGRPPLL